MRTVLVTSRSFSSGDLDLNKYLADNDCKVIIADSKHDLTELKKYLGETDAWIAGTSPVTSEMLALAPKLKVIARYGVGFESVDLNAASEKGIVVTNTPGANSLAVAELTIGLIFSSLRGIVKSASNVRNQDWSVIRGRQIEGSIVGIIGFGRIGRILAAKLKTLGCEILISDPYVSADEITKAGFQSKSLDEIAASANIVSLNAPGDSTLINSHWISIAKADQVIINSARAELVDEAALAQGLQSKKISQYAADTLAGEKNSKDSPLMAPELSDRVIVTAHLGAQTVEAIDAMGKISCDNALAVLNGKAPLNPVSK